MSSATETMWAVNDCCRGNPLFVHKVCNPWVIPMSRRFTRRVVFAAKLTALSVAVALIWLYFAAKSLEVNEKFFYQKFTKRKSNKTEINISNEDFVKSIGDLRKNIESFNKNQKIYNLDAFGALSDSDLILVVQVHNRTQYLSSLIRSLEKTEGIGQTLLIFSHDVFDPQINSLVQSIRFCKVWTIRQLSIGQSISDKLIAPKVIQIFYPHSLQLNPNTFPGQSPDDCPRDISREE